MRLVTGGSFLMGSDRREQGRRANEYQRRITLSRPFYLAVHEVTNAEFRRFKSGHSSGLLGKRTLDLDSFAVSGVSWQDAVQYCNWLSERDGLAPAYEQRQGRWVLREPVTTGYRLPTEAEWEFVARHERPGAATRRYEWGNSLPPPRNFANLAGDEVKEELPKVLPSWQDDYPVVAPPGRFPANAFGIFDMSGNVSEWLHDAYSPTDPVGSTTDPLGPASGTRHVVKGASWRTHVYTDLRVGWREGVEGTAADLGFRVARYAE
jgi:formylglycine-generating enzyme required for sulfatase activity